MSAVHMKLIDKYGHCESAGYEYADFVNMVKTNDLPKGFKTVIWWYDGETQRTYLKKNGRWQYDNIDKLKYS